MLSDLSKPPVLNKEGVKFWLDKSLTGYAVEKGIHGVSLPHHKVFIAETPDGARTRLLSDGNQWIFESPLFEAVAAKIDMEKLAARPIERR